MNALQLVDRLNEAEYRITHLKMIIDQLSTEPDMKESTQVLGDILKDYETHFDKTRQTLGSLDVQFNLNSGGNNHRNEDQ